METRQPVALLAIKIWDAMLPNPCGCLVYSTLIRPPKHPPVTILTCDLSQAATPTYDYNIQFSILTKDKLFSIRYNIREMWCLTLYIGTFAMKMLQLYR